MVDTCLLSMDFDSGGLYLVSYVVWNWAQWPLVKVHVEDVAKEQYNPRGMHVHNIDQAPEWYYRFGLGVKR